MNAKQKLHYYILKEDIDKIVQIVENSLVESYEEKLDIDDKVQVLASLNEPAVLDYIEKVENLNIITEFNLNFLVVVDYVDLFQFEKDYIAYNDNDESKEFNVKDLVKDILL